MPTATPANNNSDDDHNFALFAPYHGGGPAGLRLAHRIVLAPLTRNRAAEPTLAPHALHAEYYAQRTTPGGLIITEATCISPEAVAYPSVPGLWNTEQADAWRVVTNAVHAKGGVIFCQLWHTGRVAHAAFGNHPLLKRQREQQRTALGAGAGAGANTPRPAGEPVSASARPILDRRGNPPPTQTYAGVEPRPAPPRALRLDEIPHLLDDYRRAARLALRAGFDGVELHAAHGYLIDQFLQDGVNQREDAYGGSVEKRTRLLREATAALVGVMGPGRVAVRLSPTTRAGAGGRQQVYYGCRSTDPDAQYAAAVHAMNAFPLAYLLLTEPRWTGRADGDPTTDKGFAAPLSNARYRQVYHGTLMAAGGFTPRSAAVAVASGTYDLIAFGRWFISNPDLVERLRTGAPLNVYDRSTFYEATSMGGGASGYTDYPSLDGSVGVPGKYATMDQGRIGQSLGAAKSKL